MVSIYVDLESTALSGSVLAMRTLEGLLAGVDAHVHSQMRPLYCRVVAHSALERLNACMLRRVLDQMDLLVERRGTQVAVKQLFLSCLRRFVSLFKVSFLQWKERR